MPIEPVRGRAADEEAPAEQPEGPRATTRGGARRRTRRGTGCRWRVAGRVVLDGAVRPQPHVGRAGRGEAGARRGARSRARPAQPRRPTSASRERRRAQASSRQEHELPGRVRRGRIPVARPRRATNQRFATTAASVTETAPVAIPLTTPQRSANCQVLGHRAASRASRAPPSPRGRDASPQPEAVVERRSERPAEAVQHQVETRGERDRGRRPAELLVQRVDEHPDRRAEARHRHERHERRRRGRPSRSGRQAPDHLVEPARRAPDGGEATYVAQRGRARPRRPARRASRRRCRR